MVAPSNPEKVALLGNEGAAPARATGGWARVLAGAATLGTMAVAATLATHPGLASTLGAGLALPPVPSTGDLSATSVRPVAGMGSGPARTQEVEVSTADPVVAVASLGAYPTFIYHVNGFGCKLSSAPYVDGRNDLDALSTLAQSEDVRIVYLSNPDNPTGTWYSTGALSRFIDTLPDHCVFILDEAYTEFAPEEATPPIQPIHPRVIRMRTFSKAHGLAGARIGYAICSAEIASGFDKIRLHFGVNRIAQVGALASLGDTEFIAAVIASVETGRQEYEALGKELGLATLPSATNFVTFDAGEASRADAILERLVEQRVFIRKPRVEALDRYFRVTVGRADERALFAERLKEILRST